MTKDLNLILLSNLFLVATLCFVHLSLGPVRSEGEINILLVGSADPRHILKTIAGLHDKQSLHVSPDLLNWLSSNFTMSKKKISVLLNCRCGWLKTAWMWWLGSFCSSTYLLWRTKIWKSMVCGILINYFLYKYLKFQNIHLFSREDRSFSGGFWKWRNLQSDKGNPATGSISALSVRYWNTGGCHTRLPEHNSSQGETISLTSLLLHVSVGHLFGLSCLYSRGLLSYTPHLIKLEIILINSSGVQEPRNTRQHKTITSTLHSSRNEMNSSGYSTRGNGLLHLRVMLPSGCLKSGSIASGSISVPVMTTGRAVLNGILQWSCIQKG